MRARSRLERQGPRQGIHLGIATQERANIDAALAWTAKHDPMLGLKIANAFGWTSVVLGEGAAAAERIRGALGAADHLAPAEQRALAMAFVGWNEVGADIERATTEAERAVDLADTTADAEVIAVSRFSLAFALLHSGRPRDAIDLLHRWRAVAGDHVRAWHVAMGDVLIGYAGFAAGDVAGVRAACGEAVPLLPAIGDDWLTSHVEAILGQLAQAEQRLPDAADHFRRAADAAHRVGASAAEGFHLANLGRVLQLSGDHRAAISTLEQGIEIIRAVGLMRSLALSRVHLGRLQREVGDVEGARSAIESADAWFRDSGGGDEAAVAQCLLAAMDAKEGVPDAAGRLDVILEKAQAANDLEVQVLALDALACLRAEAGDIIERNEMLERADALAASSGHKLTEGDRLDGHRARALLDAADVAPAS
ncbi:MAG TPA: tetratricopeptide repeat protein [Mycobacterium sp.]